jgi:hypothetical protein
LVDFRDCGIRLTIGALAMCSIGESRMTIWPPIISRHSPQIGQSALTQSPIEWRNRSMPESPLNRQSSILNRQWARGAPAHGAAVPAIFLNMASARSRISSIFRSSVRDAIHQL